MSYALEQSYTYISIDDYFAGERDVEFRSEYLGEKGSGGKGVSTL
jgi:hypothetical protein